MTWNLKINRFTNRNLDTLTDQVYEGLRNAIITGEIPGGTRLVESALAAKMKVSRTPVREALHRLAVEGFLYSVPRSGYIVVEMSDYDIEDLFTIRLAIEQLAASLAIEKITPVELKEMELNLKKTDEKIENGQTEGMTELDVQFHGIIYKATRSRTLYHICRSLSDHSLKYRIALIHLAEFAKKTRDGHYQIYTALVEKRKDKLERAIHDHLVLAKQDILKMLEQTRNELFFSEGI